MSVFDMSISTYVAVALNASVAGVALLLAGLAPFTAPAVAPASAEADAALVADASGRRLVFVAIALSGLTALACEVLWTRLMSLLFGATTYTFSLILAVFLAGLGLGSSAGAAAARSLARPRVALGWVQLGLCVAMAWTTWVLTESLPYWPINPSIAPNVWFQFQLDLVRALFAVLPLSLIHI